MEPGNYVNSPPEESKRLQTAQRMQTTPTQRDQAKQSEYRKFLKIRTIVFGVVAAVMLIIGLPLVIVYRDTKGRAAWVIGLLLSIIGSACTLIFLIYLPSFMRLMASRSQAAAHSVRTAEALGDVSYPRQAGVAASMTPEVPPPPMPTATNPNYDPANDPLLQSGAFTHPPTAPQLPPIPTEEPPRYDYIQRGA